MCELCDPFDAEITIHGPGQLRRIVTKLQEAVRSGVLLCTASGSGDSSIDQVPFSQLGTEERIPDIMMPDIMMYDFSCSRCGIGFALRVETYHGQGGTWSRIP